METAMENGFRDAGGQIRKAEYADTAFVIQLIFFKAWIRSKDEGWSCPLIDHCCPILLSVFFSQLLLLDAGYSWSHRIGIVSAQRIILVSPLMEEHVSRDQGNNRQLGEETVSSNELKAGLGQGFWRSKFSYLLPLYAQESGSLLMSTVIFGLVHLATLSLAVMVRVSVIVLKINVWHLNIEEKLTFFDLWISLGVWWELQATQIWGVKVVTSSLRHNTTE